VSDIVAKLSTDRGRASDRDARPSTR